MKNNESTNELSDFIEVLKYVEEKVRNTHQEESRTFRSIFGWIHPPMTQVDLADKIKRLRRYVERSNFVLTNIARMKARQLRKDFTDWSNEPLSNLYTNNAINVCYSLDCLLDASYTFLKSIEDVSTIEDLQTKYEKERARLDALRFRLDSALSNTGNIDEVIEKIQEADKTAQSLPETMASLRRARNEAAHHLSVTKRTIEDLEQHDKSIKELYAELQHHNEEASETLKKCEEVLASATSAGLAHAFNERKEELQEKGKNWTYALVASLCLTVVAVWWRADAIFAFLDKSRQMDSIAFVANFFISIAFVGAPIWFAWLATKQVGYYFRLSEDYGFKAAVSTSYEGFRNQAARFDEDLERKVLDSTLNRYDESPLRFVDERVVGSPYHEILTSKDFKEAVKTIPGFVYDVMDFSKNRLRSRKNIEPIVQKGNVNIDTIEDSGKIKH